MWDNPEDNFIADDTSLDRETARELYRLGFGGDLNLTSRWARVVDPAVIRFVDVVNAAHGHAESNGMISCPFHGRDSHPSFKLYLDHGFCFGCPPKQMYYDAVGFVAAKFGYTRLQAITWLEKKYDLPKLESTDEEDNADETEDGDEIVSLNFHHLAPPYIKLAAQRFRQDLDADTAHGYIRIYFESMPDRKEHPDSPEALEKAVGLARVLGSKAVEQLKKQRSK
jgi:hypothetical protein